MNGQKYHIEVNEIKGDIGEFIQGFTCDVVYELICDNPVIWKYFPTKSRNTPGHTRVKLHYPLKVNEDFMRKMCNTVLHEQ